jgi:chromate transporter
VLALSGLMLMPIIILVGLATIYDRFSDLPDVRAGIAAAAAGAVGLTWGTGVKLARTILKSPVAIAIAVTSFVAIGVLRLPMLATILALAPLAIAAGFLRDSR